jgi:phosphoribosyl 1,2-cyclic phosphate phosphodiesterase
MSLKVTFLGTGTSQGVPVITCDCEICTSNDPRDSRLRSSIMIESESTRLVIDTGPDFRQQMLREDVKTLDGVLFTHEHKDHVAGLDDVRAFNFAMKQDMEVYCVDRVGEALKREFHYVFNGDDYPGIPKINLNYIQNKEFVLGDLKIQPIEVMHYKLPVLGFRLGDFTYITDAKTISESEKQKIKGSKIVVLNALRRHDHLSHFTLDEAVSMMEELNPNVGYFTHISHYLGKHQDVSSELPENMYLAHDGLVLELED